MSVLLIVSLLIFPIKTLAVTENSGTAADTSFEIVSENENISIASAAEGIISGGIYNIKNVNSGKYLNVHNGVDTDGTNVYQWTKDGSAEQNFKIIYSPATDSYTFYAMCSSNGNGRVINVDLVRGTELLTSGQNVSLWDQDAGYTQQMVIIPLGQNQYRIACKFNTDLYLTSCGTANGSSGGTSSTSTGNIFISSYVGNMTQHWIFEQVGTASAAPPEGNTEFVNASGVTGWVWRNYIPDTPVEIHVYVNNAQGETVGFYPSVANIYRQDLYNCGFGSGYHGFFCPIDWKTYVPGNYTIIVYAIGYNGYNPAINHMPIYTVSNCEGVVDVIDSTRVSGWLWKPSAPDAAIDVHVHINRLNGENIGFYAATASNYREDLQSLGYGNGCHGYWINIDWTQYPEEQLQVVLYAVDGSGYNPSFWSGTFNNYRTPINLVGITDENGNKFYTTFADPMTNWCQNIGCSGTNIYTETNFTTAVDYIKQAYYCVYFTHGEAGIGLEWRTATGDDGVVSASYIGTLADGYFDNTKCLLLMACEGGYGGATGSNEVNAFYNKGVDVVVGFQTSIFFYYYDTEGAANHRHMVTDKGAPSWARQFTKSLGEGKTIDYAIRDAYDSATVTPGSGTTDDGTPIPADYGLGSIYIAGNTNEIIKH